jgi:hypothetical protein
VAVAPTAEPRRVLPLLIVGAGACALVAAVPFGPKSALAGAAVFTIAALLAAREAVEPAVTWPNAIGAMIWLIWLVPIKLYSFPINLGFRLEPYRVVLVAMLVALGVWAFRGRGRITALGSGRALLALGAAGLLTQVLNFHELTAQGGAAAALKSLSYFLSFLLFFVLVASVTTSFERVETALRALVVGGGFVAAFAIYESRTGYDAFDHLSQWLPALQQEDVEVFDPRGGLLRVHASAQHPIALSVAMAMVVPLALYLATRARTTAGRWFWILASGLTAAAAVVTISRTAIAMFVAMPLVGLWLRGQRVGRYWPLLLLLVPAIHFASPGALGAVYNSFVPKGGLVSDLESGGGEYGSGRFADVKPGLQLFAERPFVGRGIGATILPPDTPEVLSSAPSSAAIIFDDEYLNTLVTMGLIGLVAAIWFVWGCVIGLARGARQLTGPPSDLLVACCAAATAFAISMFLFDAFSFVQATLVFVIIAAIGLRVRTMMQPAPEDELASESR